MNVVNSTITKVLTKAVVFRDADYFEPYCKGIAEQLGLTVLIYKAGSRNYIFWVEVIFKVIVTGPNDKIEILEETY